MNLNNLILLKRALVDTENIFMFCDNKFQIDKTNKDYKVKDTITEKEDYNNTAKMMFVNIMLDTETYKIMFVNENNKLIKQQQIKKL